MHPSQPKGHPSAVRKNVWLLSVLRLNNAASLTAGLRSLDQNADTKRSVTSLSSPSRGMCALTMSQAFSLGPA